jgi:SHS2 domain-containing protein
LDAVLYEMGTRGMLFSRFDVQATATGLQATAWGEPVDPRKHEPAVEVKAATYAGLEVRREADGSWMAQCVVDV